MQQRRAAEPNAGDFPLERPMPSHNKTYYSYEKFQREEIVSEHGYKPYTNENGGKIWLSKTPVNQKDTLAIFNQHYKRGLKATILSGSDGSMKGLRTPHYINPEFYKDDLKFWSKCDNIDCQNIAELSHGELINILRGPKDVIMSVCYSRNDRAVLEALNLMEEAYYVPRHLFP